MKVECSCAFLPSEIFHPTELLTYFVRKLKVNKIKIVEFTEESVFMHWKPCAEIQSVFSVYSIRQISFWLCINCSKIQEFENRRDLYIPALGLFNYHIKVKRKCLYQFLINLTLSISIRQITDVLKQRPEVFCKNRCS